MTSAPGRINRSFASSINFARTERKRSLPKTSIRPGLLYVGLIVALEFVMAPRAYWKGYLKLSLVSCPIALFPATSEREKISFHQLNKNTGHRIKYRKVDAESGEEVDSTDIIKGYTTSSLIPRNSKLWRSKASGSSTSMSSSLETRSTSCT